MTHRPFTKLTPSGRPRVLKGSPRIDGLDVALHSVADLKRSSRKLDAVFHSSFIVVNCQLIRG